MQATEVMREPSREWAKRSKQRVGMVVEQHLRAIVVPALRWAS
jgi:hypothetical protein